MSSLGKQKKRRPTLAKPSRSCLRLRSESDSRAANRSQRAESSYPLSGERGSFRESISMIPRRCLTPWRRATLLPDVNVLVYAYRQDSADHQTCHGWLEALVNGDEAYGISDLVLSGFLRVVTHPRVFREPSPLPHAREFAESIRRPAQCVSVVPGARHWRIFTDLCQAVGAKGNLIPDAYLAALAIESGSEWVTTDGDFARFPGLRWSLPAAR